ncbi:unnamed protein product, partial [Discosporangium mesarthrocarpum]
LNATASARSGNLKVFGERGTLTPKMLGRLASSGRVLLLRGSENPFASVQTPSVDLRILSSLPRTSRRNETRYLSSDAAAVQQEGDGGSTGDQVGGGE